MFGLPETEKSCTGTLVISVYQVRRSEHLDSVFVPGSKRPFFFTRVNPQKPLYCSGTCSKLVVLSGKHHSHDLISDSTMRSSEIEKHVYRIKRFYCLTG